MMSCLLLGLGWWADDKHEEQRIVAVAPPPSMTHAAVAKRILPSATQQMVPAAAECATTTTTITPITLAKQDPSEKTAAAAAAGLLLPPTQRVQGSTTIIDDTIVRKDIPTVILWDIENVQVPRRFVNYFVSSLLAEYGTCRISALGNMMNMNKEMAMELHGSGIDLLLIPTGHSSRKETTDRAITRKMAEEKTAKRFVLISNDGDFATDIALARQRGCTCDLIHGNQPSEFLLRSTANRCLKLVKFLPPKGKSLPPTLPAPPPRLPQPTPRAPPPPAPSRAPPNARRPHSCVDCRRSFPTPRALLNHTKQSHC